MGDLDDAKSANQLISVKGLAGFMATSSILDEFNMSSNYFANIERVHLETGWCEHLGKTTFLHVAKRKTNLGKILNILEIF